MSAILSVNPNAETARAIEVLSINISAAAGLEDFFKSNLGPKGTMKMLVSGAGDVKITKDGNVLIHETQIKHPIASLIARTCTAQDDVTGDGTTSTVLFIGQLLQKTREYIVSGVHPRFLVEGFEIARVRALEILDKISVKCVGDRDQLLDVARTSLRTKMNLNVADLLAAIVTDAVLCIRQENEKIDLHMVEIMEMAHQTEMDTKLIRGLVLDHGARHPDMPKRLDNVYILTCNVSMEYEKTEVNSEFFYKTPEEREKLVEAEKQFILQRVKQVIALKQKVCKSGEDKGFIVINQKGIDPTSLDMLAREGIMALRRAKRRNMERLVLACGGAAVNSFDDLTPDVLGFAGSVYEQVLGEDKFTFVEECKNPKSVTILIKGPNKHTITQNKEAIRKGLRAVFNAIEDGRIVPGAGAFEFAVHQSLRAMLHSDENKLAKTALGVRAFAEAILIIPRTLLQNSGYDWYDFSPNLEKTGSKLFGVDCDTGNVLFPEESAIWDNYSVKKQLLNSCTQVASNMLLVDVIMRAGLASLRGPEGQ